MSRKTESNEAVRVTAARLRFLLNMKGLIRAARNGRHEAPTLRQHIRSHKGRLYEPTCFCGVPLQTPGRFFD